MLKNYLTIAFRTLVREKYFSLIKILSLSVALTFSLLLLLWVQNEWLYNKMFPEVDRIFQAHMNFEDESGEINTISHTPYGLLTAMKTEMSQIEEAGAMFPSNKNVLKSGDNVIQEDGVYGNYSMLDVLGIPLLAGGMEGTEDQLNGMFISDQLAKKLYGEHWRDDIGSKTIQVNLEEPVFAVLGVYETLPENSSFDFQYVLNAERLIKQNPGLEGWGWNGCFVYGKLKPDADKEGVEQMLAGVFAQTEEYEEGASIFLHALGKKYLYDKFENGEAVGGKITYVRIFLLVAIFLLFIACINFFNLSSAQTIQRGKEVGVRKVLGAKRSWLIQQFLVEVSLYIIIATGLAITLIELLLPWIREITGKELVLPVYEPYFWGGLIGLLGMMTLMAGAYPAWMLASLRIVNMMKGRFNQKWRNLHIRKGLVIIQFTLSLLLIIGAVIVQRQIHFIKNENLGLERENIFYLGQNSQLKEHYDAFHAELMREPAIKDMVRGTHAPLNVGMAYDGFNWAGKDPDKDVGFWMHITENQFDDMFGVEMVSGRFFSEDFATDSNAIVLNETAIERMGVDQPVGLIVEMFGERKQVVGVVKDYHMHSLHRSIGPLMIVNSPRRTWNVFIKAEAGYTQEALAAVEKVYAQFVTEFPFHYEFLDDQYNQLYQSETMIGKLANGFAVIAIFISCLGLLGLALFAASRRTKEIGIRKVLGASVANIVGLLSKDFLVLVIISCLIAVPISWYIMQQWLENFAYRISLDGWIFVIAGMAALFIALLTISFHSIKAAMANPVESLRNE